MTQSSRIFICFSLLCASLSIASAEQTISYKNQRGSTLILTWSDHDKETGSLTGTFTTAVGNCPKDMNVPMPISGYFNGNAVALTVNFPNCKQVVAMTGNLNPDETELHTLWLDANQSKDAQGNDWTANIIGADHFVKVK